MLRRSAALKLYPPHLPGAEFLSIIIIIIIITAVELSLGGSSPYTSTEKQIRMNELLP
jgi:hypothetical protein